MLIIKTKIEGVGEKTLEIKENGSFEPTVYFYRSKKSANGNFGASDTDYNGEFGFDWYDSKVDGEGKTAQSDFEKLTIANTDYFVPWLVLWPPKSALSKYGNIDSSFNPVNKTTICLKIDDGISTGGKGKLRAKTSSPNLIINGSQEIELSEVKIKDKIEIDIEVLDELDKDESIEIYPVNSEIVIGKLNVLKNDVINVIEPQMYEVGVNTVSLSTNMVTMPLSSTYSSIFDYLQLNSLNQALVYIKKPIKVANFTINEIDIEGYTTNSSGEKIINYTLDNQHYLNKLVLEKWYELSTGKKLSPEPSGGKNIDLSSLRSPANKMFKSILKSFKNLAGNPHRLQLALEENQDKINTYKIKRAKFPDPLPDKQKKGFELHNDLKEYIIKHKDIHTPLLFAFPSIEEFQDVASGKIQFDKNPGYSINGYCTVFGFNQLFKDAGTVAHEFGHAFGLKHTFEVKAGKSMVKTKNELLGMEKLYESISKTIEEMLLNKFLIYETFATYSNSVINQIDNLLQIHFINWIEEENNMTSKDIKIDDNPSLEEESQITPTSLNKGETRENFMDYANGRKVFSLNQIRLIQENL